MIKVMTVFGTRPDAIKMAPVARALQGDPRFELIVTVTGQHREMLDQVLRVFQIKPDFDLQIMSHGQTLSEISTRALSGLDKVLAQNRVDVVLAQGDTTTTFVAALTAFYHKIPFGHVEAGLRTYDLYNPFPEEMNRRLCAPLAEYHFAPTEQAHQNLISERIPAERIWVTGNTGIDAVLWVAEQPLDLSPELQSLLNREGRMILLTCHRRENLGEPMTHIAQAARALLERFPDTYLILPMHKNPLVREILTRYLDNHPRAFLIEPLDYAPFAHTMKRAHLILTDSGGVQEEAPSLGKPVLVMRETTERPEGVHAGTSKLVGTEMNLIVEEAAALLEDEALYHRMAQAVNPYGDGHAAERIVQILSDNRP